MRTKGFTLIELMVTLAILATLVALAVPRYFNNVDRTKEDVLREDLYVMRDAIDKYYVDMNVYPNLIDDLVTAKYLRAIPVEPFTQSSHSWVVVPAADASQGVVSNVHSGAPNTGSDGTWLKDW
jgi:general secretion pathway protein G